LPPAATGDDGADPRETRPGDTQEIAVGVVRVEHFGAPVAKMPCQRPALAHHVRTLEASDRKNPKRYSGRLVSSAKRRVVVERDNLEVEPVTIELLGRSQGV
jgi:hypothetical protein